jgi:nucleotide-binding universal stress UspA family protein
MNTKPRTQRHRVLFSSVRTVTCGTDFSPTARTVADAAAALARVFQSPLEIVHVSDLRMNSETVETLEAETRRLRAKGVEVREVLRVGRPAEELVKVAGPDTCRLVLVGPTGVGGAKAYGFGSTASRTAERAQVPTLVVRDAHPFAAWSTGERPLRILVAYDFSASADAALGWVREMRASGRCDVTIGCVEWPPVGRTQLVISNRNQLAANATDLRTTLKQELKLRATKVLRSSAFKVNVEVNSGPTEVWLMEMARQEKADLVVLGTHGYRGLERLWRSSVSRTVLDRSGISVAVVPAADTGKATLASFAMHRIMVATDFSETANRAILQAFSLATGRGEVFLVHVTHPGALPEGEYQQGPADRRSVAQHSRYLRQCEMKLRGLIPKEADRLGIMTTIEVVEERQVAAAIAKAAERLGADVICAGTHGRTGLSRALLGSVAQDLVRYSKRPLLLIRSA